MIKGFTFKLWNGEYGNKAKFIVKDNNNNKFSLFSPSRPKDLTWGDKNLSESDDYSSWEDFENEQVGDLDDVVF